MVIYMKLRKLKSNDNKLKKYLYTLVIVFTLLLSVGYSALNEDLKISAEASFRVLEDLRITDVSLYETTNNGIERYQSKYTKDSITMGVDLKETGSTVTYKVEVTNYGTVQ